MIVPAVPAVLNLPVLDLSETDRSVLGDRFRSAGEQTGFMQIVNHGVPRDLIFRAFEMAKVVFELPVEEKMKLARDPKTSRGYLVFGGQKLQGSLGSGHEGASSVSASKSQDHKEGFTIGRQDETTERNLGRLGHGDNKYPPTELVPDLKELGEEYTDAMLRLQARMMDIVAASFGTDPKTGVTADILRDAVINWRFLHYPSSDEPDVIGVGAHTDFGFTTLLATNGTPGLEVFNQGQWHPVEPEAGAFIVNIGDALSRLSGGRYKSSLHRVINNTGPKARYSIPCFLEGNLDFVVKPLDTPAHSVERFPTVEDLLRARHQETFSTA